MKPFREVSRSTRILLVGLFFASFQALEESPDLGSAITDELKKVMRESDSNQNGILEEAELTKILNRPIKTRY